MRENLPLSELDLYREHQRIQLINILCFVTFNWNNKGDRIGDAGAAVLSESLKSDTTLTELSLSGENKRKKTHK